jgi:hypothetical protein
MRKLMLIAVVALVLPSAALAGGPSSASIQGPGILTITLSWNGEGASLFWRLTEATGFYPATFRPSPDPMLRTQPEDDLGPRYTITWVLPTPTGNTLHQDVYPYAKPYPLTYMPRGQKFNGGMTTNGGWYVGGAELKRALARAGFPAQPPSRGGASLRVQPPPAASGPALSTAGVAAIAAAGTGVLALAFLLAIRIRRRPRSAATT